MGVRVGLKKALAAVRKKRLPRGGDPIRVIDKIGLEVAHVDAVIQMEIRIDEVLAVRRQDLGVETVHCQIESQRRRRVVDSLASVSFDIGIFGGQFWRHDRRFNDRETFERSVRARKRDDRSTFERLGREFQRSVYQLILNARFVQVEQRKVHGVDQDLTPFGRYRTFSDATPEKFGIDGREIGGQQEFGF